MEADQNSERRHYSEVNDVGVFFVNCERISHFLLIVDFEQKTFPGFILKRQTLLKTRLGMLYYFKRKQNLLINSISTYISTTLRVNE